MLVWLAEYLQQYHSGFNVISYITVRAILALLTALLISLWVGPKVIRRLQILKFGQEVRNDGPESHLSKKRHANNGRHYDFVRYHYQHLAVGEFSQPLYLVQLICAVRLWCGGLCGRLPQNHA